MVHPAAPDSETVNWPPCQTLSFSYIHLNEMAQFLGLFFPHYSITNLCVIIIAHFEPLALSLPMEVGKMRLLLGTTRYEH